MIIPIHLVMILIMMLLVYLVLAFTYHVYKLESLIRRLYNNQHDVDDFFDTLESQVKEGRCSLCNRNDSTCGCN